MNFYSSEPFLEVLASVYFPGHAARVLEFQLQESAYRLLEIDGHRVITSWPFLDFVEPLEDGELIREDRRGGGLRYVPKACIGRVTAEEWRDGRFAERYEPSPLVDWTAFPTWAAFEAFVRARRSKLFADSRRQARKLEAAAGPLSFSFADAEPDVLGRALGWKASQYVAAGFPNHLAVREHTRLFEELARVGFLTISSLRAGGTLVAAHVGVVHEGRFSYWMPAYEPSMAAFSPGRLLLEALLQASQELGHREFDFLIGDEDYKWFYATHARLIGPVGKPPIDLVLKKRLKGVAKTFLGLSPAGLDLARRVKRRLG